MNLSKLKHRNLIIFIIIYILIRILLININYTEWGDTFRMIRGAEYLSNFDWPWDEKRWPLYSFFLLPGVLFNIPILWGRILGIAISSMTLVYVYFFYLKFIKIRDSQASHFFKNLLFHIDKNRQNYALLTVAITALSPVFAYWSLRVMADPLFTLFVIMFFYHFMEWFDKDKVYDDQVWMLSITCIFITMLRLEGLFVLFGVLAYLLIKQHYKYILMFLLPQILIYLPWTLYAKVLYKGPVNNDYLNEVQTFVFNWGRFEYFIGYTFFILGIPVLFTFLILGFKKFYNSIHRSDFKLYLIYLPLVLFILQELFIGFIWTPSLPRIYTPIIPFLVMISVFGIETFNVNRRRLSKDNLLFITISILLIAFYIFIQMKYKLYFLGASKITFMIMVGLNYLMILIMLYPKLFKKYLISLIIISLVLVSTVVINNQRFVYKTVKLGIEYLEESKGYTAYSDETGNSEWYFRNSGFYLDTNSKIDNIETQNRIFNDNDIQYLLWTNEFNRGSIFIDPVNSNDYEELVKYEQPIRDPFDIILDKLGIIEDKDYMIFVTKVYSFNPDE